uniref:DUF7808 domain-containing protein n=1 Tax=Setaria digitata TaxID=48799 RepID=A0A915PEX5_9BILA
MLLTASHQAIIPVVCIVAFVNVVSPVDFSKLVNWEKRTLTCFGSDIQKTAHYRRICLLTIVDNPKLLETECYDEKYTEESFGEAKKNKTFPRRVRTVCDIRCAGADRDSVISKIPNSVHECVRWFNYNTLKKGINYGMAVVIATEIACHFSSLYLE